MSFSFVWVSMSHVNLYLHAVVSFFPFRFWCLGSCLQPETQTVPANAGALRLQIYCLSVYFELSEVLTLMIQRVFFSLAKDRSCL